MYDLRRKFLLSYLCLEVCAYDPFDAEVCVTVTAVHWGLAGVCCSSLK